METYEATPEQAQAADALSKQGFRFSNWISAQDGNDAHGCMVCVKRTKPGRTEYREIDPSGSIN